MSYFVYIVECADSSLYAGIAKDPQERVLEHNGEKKGGAKYTRGRRPVSLKYSQEYQGRSEACREEARIKKLSRAQKLELIALGPKTKK